MVGMTVTLINEVEIGVDALGNAVYDDVETIVENVLIGEPTTDDITTANNLYGKHTAYILGIPKGDANNWVDSRVRWTDAYGNIRTVKTFGYPITGVEANIPGPWHMKVRCEIYG